MELNKIYNGDCLDLMKNIKDKSIDMIVTDPPYLIKYKTNRRKNKSHDFCSEILNDDNEELIIDYIKECFRILKENTAIYIFCSFDKVDFFKQEIEKYFNIKNIIIWIKNNHTSGDLDAQYGKRYEMIIYANKGRKKINGKRISDLWSFNKIVGKYQIHQNQKPLELIKQCILKSSLENDVIFDGFSGSGTTAIACINTKRKYICIEKDQKYYEMSLQRVKDFTAQLTLF